MNNRFFKKKNDRLPEDSAFSTESVIKADMHSSFHSASLKGQLNFEITKSPLKGIRVGESPLKSANIIIQSPLIPQCQKHKNVQNHFEYFSATLSQVCIHHDELGWLGAGLTVKELCQVFWLRITLADKARTKPTKAGDDPVIAKFNLFKIIKIRLKIFLFNSIMHFYPSIHIYHAISHVMHVDFDRIFSWRQMRKAICDLGSFFSCNYYYSFNILLKFPIRLDIYRIHC